jgi:hypothetical protein
MRSAQLAFFVAVTVALPSSALSQSQVNEEQTITKIVLISPPPCMRMT